MPSPERSRRTPRPQAATRFRVTVLGREVALQEGENLIGRAADTTIFIDDASVSRIHASIHVAGEATLHDLGSKNGTFLNGERLTEPRSPAPPRHHRRRRRGDDLPGHEDERFHDDGAGGVELPPVRVLHLCGETKKESH